LIELAYEQAEAAGLALWCQDEAGPYQAIPHPGETWHPQGQPTRQPHEYVRGGTAKLLTLFRPAIGTVRAKGVLSAPNVVLHPWQSRCKRSWRSWSKTHCQSVCPCQTIIRCSRPGNTGGGPMNGPNRLQLSGSFSSGTISRGTSRTTWCAGCCSMAFCRSIRRFQAPGSTWPNRSSASWCAARSPGSIRRPPSKSSIGWNKRWLGGINILPPLYGMASAGGDVSVPAYAAWRLWCGSAQWLLNCRLTH
jgi:hypothetical protein